MCLRSVCVRGATSAAISASEKLRALIHMGVYL
jgi:hypothetical protein